MVGGEAEVVIYVECEGRKGGDAGATVTVLAIRENPDREGSSKTGDANT